MKSILTFENFSLAFSHQAPVVDDISFNVETAKITALVGESGSGKSVTAMSVLRLLENANHINYQGRIDFDQHNILELSNKQLRGIRGNDIGFIFQEPMMSLNPLHRIEKQIGETLMIHQGLTVNQSRPKIIQWLEKVGIRDASARLQDFPHQFSGGEQQRIMIAMALINEPKLLIADEPTTALDVTIQAQIIELLQSLQQSLNLTILFITHDLSVVKRIADKVVVMQKGKIVEQGNTDEIFNHAQNAYTQTLINTRLIDSIFDVDKKQDNLISCDNFNVWYPIKKGIFQKIVAHNKAVNDIQVTIEKNTSVAIIGESGSGKSTFAKALIGLESFDGIYQFEDRQIENKNKQDFADIRKNMQMMFQDPFGSLSPRMLVGDIIAEGLLIHKIGDTQTRAERVKQALIDVKLDPQMATRYPHEFSGGQRQRIALARALVMQPKCLILDEPTSALDKTIEKDIIVLLKQLQDKYQLSYVFISHDLSVVKAFCEYIYVMKQGKIIEHGKNQTLFDSPQHPYTQTLLQAAFLN
ncbi:ABC transporter ATP-binding protein [Marinicellulosiphila megalodicopiae]|uniref:ABC transporter ATP-binding protein n=1 Tax=Marinicellulosiphila megalodicopiae TaxID=2724896 RepID=UPI003BB16C62